MPAGLPIATIPVWGVKITTVDPAQGLIEGVFRGDAQPRRLDVYTTSLAFRWPIVGESWKATQINGIWQLDSLWPSQSAPVTFRDVTPGDLVLNSPTGVVHVMGSDDGTTDFEVRKPRRNKVTLSVGSAIVADASVTADSLIFLTAQDNNTTGALRVSARVAGANFTIQSNDSGDHGVVAYEIHEPEA